MTDSRSFIIDLYCGPLTRFYSGNWDRDYIRKARAEGLPAHTAKSRVPINADKAFQWVLGMRSGLQSATGQMMNWDEDPAGGYFHRTVPVRAYSALILLAAYADQPDLPKPKRAPESITEDPGYKSYAKMKEKSWPVAARADLLVPCQYFERRTFSAEDPIGQKRIVGSCSDFLNDIRSLNRATFNMDDDEMHRLLDAGFEGDDFETVARFGLAAFWDMAQNASSHQRPMIIELSPAPEIILKRLGQ